MYSANFHTKLCKITVISFVFMLKVVLKYLHMVRFYQGVHLEAGNVTEYLEVSEKVFLLFAKVYFENQVLSGGLLRSLRGPRRS